MVALGAHDLSGPSTINFEMDDVQTHFPYHVYFHVHVECLNNTIKHMVIDEGTSTSIMSLSCWKGLNSPQLSQYMTMLKPSNGCSFRTHDIIPSLHVQLDGKTMLVEVKVVDALPDYNLFLGQN